MTETLTILPNQCFCFFVSSCSIFVEILSKKRAYAIIQILFFRKTSAGTQSRNGGMNMTKLLLRLFVKGYQNSEDLSVRAAVGKLAGATGIVCNGMLFLGKLLAGLLTGSVAIIADAVNNLSDASSSIVTLLGFRLAQRPADADHPYGHARYEYLSGLMVAVLILVIGIELVKSSVEKILHPEAIVLTSLSVCILIASILVKLWMARFFRTLGKQIHSLTLEATSLDSRNDVISTTAVLLGCLIGFLFQVNIDGYVGLAVAVFILYSGFNMVKETISPLLGQQADAELIQKINTLVLSHEEVLGIHDLLVHDYGPGRCFASLHLELNAAKDPLACHELIDHIENDLLRELNVDMVIHYDPVVIDDAETNQLRAIVEEILSEMDERLSLHDFRMIKGETSRKLCFDLEVPYDMGQHYEEMKKEIDAKLCEKAPNCTTEIRFDSVF